MLFDEEDLFSDPGRYFIRREKRIENRQQPFLKREKIPFIE
jgi:hypothetical protein